MLTKFYRFMMGNNDISFQAAGQKSQHGKVNDGDKKNLLHVLAVKEKFLPTLVP